MDIHTDIDHDHDHEHEKRAAARQTTFARTQFSHLTRCVHVDVGPCPSPFPPLYGPGSSIRTDPLGQSHSWVLAVERTHHITSHHSRPPLLPHLALIPTIQARTQRPSIPCPNTRTTCVPGYVFSSTTCTYRTGTKTVRHPSRPLPMRIPQCNNARPNAIYAIPFPCKRRAECQIPTPIHKAPRHIPPSQAGFTPPPPPTCASAPRPSPNTSPN